MKKLLLFFIAVCFSYSVQAQSDSCYVYTQIYWAPAATKYVAKIQDSKGDFDIPLDDNNEKIYFNSIMNAVNYYSSKGWEYVEMYYKKGESISELQQYVVIRKKMLIENALEYTSPKKK